MKYKSFLLKSCLAAVCMLTGCESIVKDAKPPEQYLDSQVLDGNFIDFSDPDQVYALYKAHYDSIQGNKEYTSYSDLRGGLDIFSIDPEWSKNFISFDVVAYDRDKGNLIYAFTTTNRSKTDGEFEYTADADVTIDEKGNIHVAESITDNTSEDTFLVAAVCFYNQKSGKTKTIFSSKDTSATRTDAGIGKHNLVVKTIDDTIAVFYNDQIAYYNYNAARETYIKKQSFNMENLYSTKSFTDSASAYGFTANNGTFTIHDIRYGKNTSGELVPLWIQIEYSEPTESSEPESSSDDLIKRLEALEKNAETNVNQGTKWLDVDLSMESVTKSNVISINSQVTISSAEGITELMNAERERIEQDIADNNEKYLRDNSDVTKNITEKHLTDLQAMITACEEEVEAKEAAEAESADSESEEESGEETSVSKYSGYSARFCTEDGQTDSDPELVADTGPALLAIYRNIYDCQEKLKQQETYISACQYLKENEVYDEMLTIMEQKLDSYAINTNLDDAAKTKLQEALNRQMIQRGLAVNTAQEILVDEQMLPASMISDVADVSAWTAFSEQTMENPEESFLVSYLVEHKDAAAEKLSQTITDLETLMPLAKTAAELTENSNILSEDLAFVSSSQTDSVDDFYTMGYERILANYKEAKTALETIVSGKQQISTYRDELSNAEDEDIQICRFDLVISDARKKELRDECDRMEALLKQFYGGSSDKERTDAETELNNTKWQIDIDYKVVNGNICYTKQQLSIVIYSQVVWTSTVTDVSDAHNSYVFGDGIIGLFFDESESRVSLLSSPPDTFSDVERYHCINYFVSFYNAPEFTYGSEFYEDMDQAIITTVHCKQGNTSIREHLPDNVCQIVLLSQAEGRKNGTNTEDPKWSFIVLPYTKLGLENVAKASNVMTSLSITSYVKDLAKYGFTANMGKNNEMTYTKTVTDYATIYKEGIDTKDAEIRDLDELTNEEEQEPISVEYDVKVRGMLREENTIFLDNPKIDYGNPGNSRYYFLNLSLDEGIQLYTIKPNEGTLERQNFFQDESLKNYTEGCWFKGWWYPDSQTTYNDQGNLSGGKLVLLGLSRDDMKEYSSEEDGSLRELVEDDIYHSKLYEISISADQINACKK